MELNERYYKKFGQNFTNIIEMTAKNLSKNVNNHLIIDVANGIGSIMTKTLFDKYLP